MHLLMTTDTVGGVWSYSLELARALADRDVWVSLATMGAPLTSDQWLDVSRLDNVEVFESEFRLEWMEDAWEDVADAGSWLLEIADQTQPDVVHLNQFAHGACHWKSPCLVVGHSCVMSWHESVRRRPAGREWALYRKVVTYGVRGADLVVAPTCAMMRNLQKYYGPLKRTQVIMNGRRGRGAATRPKEPFIFTAGRMWDEGKNLAAVAAVAPALDWPVHVAGLPHPGGHETSQAENVRHLGRLAADAMNAAYQRATIYALPARYEPFGLTPLEAALAGCALVLGDIASLREVWGPAASFVPPDDTDALRTSINDLIRNTEQRERLVCRATARARELTAARMAHSYLQVYRQLLANHPRRGRYAIPTMSAIGSEVI